MTTFLTVREAAHFVHKSPSSIRRIIHPIVRADNHPDRAHIQPSVEDAVQLRLKGESFAWRISDELLQRVVPAEESTAAASKPQQSHAGDGALIAMLQRELEIKNDQIRQQTELNSNQMKLIEGLSERIRESNILIGSLQQQLALPHPAGRHDADDPKVAQTVPKPPKPKEAPKPSPKKRSRWFGW
jgi:hypothetical protein